MKYTIILFLYFIIYPVQDSVAIEYNPWNLSVFERVVHRKNISNLILEPRPDHYRLTIILSDRFPYNYKSRQYFFFMRFLDEDKALEMSQKWDKHLDSGKEIYFRLNGSEIIYYQFLD